MSLELLIEERRANILIENAKRQAEEIISEAERKGREILAEATARKTIEELIKREEAEAKVEAEKILSRDRKGAKDILKSSRKRIPKAVEFVFQEVLRV
ncbi:MAG: hypothetical protein ACE5OY_05285 [Candidatus Bathyarchaeia archaeon]